MTRFPTLFGLLGISFMAAITAAPQTALADGPYLDVKLAAVAPKTIKGATQVGQFNLDFENGFSGAIAAGWAFEHFRTDLEFNLIGADFDVVDGGIDQTITDGSLKTLMTNVYYDLTDGFFVTPYVGVGVGISFTDFNNISDGKHVAYQGMAGFRYNLSGNFWVGAEYRYLNTGSDQGIDNFKSSSFMATFSLGF